MVLFGCSVLLVMHYSGRRHLAKTSNFYNAKVDECIERIWEITQQIRNINEMITEIELSGIDRMKNFSQEFTTIIGKKISVDIWADGSSATTNQLKKLAEARLDELTSSLSAEIEKLNNAITKT